jgi:uncharacterized membrane protein YtjA (UPF0391 family)
MRASPDCATERDAAIRWCEMLTFSTPDSSSILMLHYSLVFLIVAIIAAVLGFSGIAGTATWIAKVLFFVFLVVWLIAFITGRKPKI